MGKLTLSPTDYFSKVLKKFNMSCYKPVPTPLAPHFKLSSHECLNSEEDKEDMSRVPYSSAVGRLMYTVVCTRLDLAHAGDLDARKSLCSYIFSHCGYAISWYLSLQAITAISTTVAEYISYTEGVKEAIWLRGMVNEFGLPQKTKHIEVRHHFVRDIVEEGEVIVDKIHTNDNPAHMLKVLTPTKFKHCLDLVGVIGV
nr:retrovirus-related Pol polyprotein from transposon TNT 1-94 [Tanacetum cinerariifolium]GFA56593.1 retrovirus-related Pol polyprotein from transposon TNT 1-94 [Tanacetum cinerariifolium]